jgi:hypothetical protein
MEWGAGIAWSAGQNLAAKAVDYLPDNDRSALADAICALLAGIGVHSISPASTSCPKMSLISDDLSRLRINCWMSRGFIGQRGGE